MAVNYSRVKKKILKESAPFLVHAFPSLLQGIAGYFGEISGILLFPFPQGVAFV
jgi:hypothetical protein